MEAALIIPILLAVSLGLVEYGLVFQEVLNLASVTRSAARLATAEPRTSASNPHQYADDGAAAAAAALDDINPTEIQQLWIYKADANGLPIDNQANSPTHGFTSYCKTCWIYSWSPATRSWTLTSYGNGWPATGTGSQDAC
ncbi:MAG TPA: TadE/TadG family type IV pilus assembly protein, partial [Actinomycetota bacterium]|nr:TadE/TadG family type IV pilus assembly protein [Actinomycetota bacterium]